MFSVFSKMSKSEFGGVTDSPSVHRGELGLLGGRGGDVFLDFLEGVAGEGRACRIPVEGGFGEGACAAVVAVAREDFLLGAEG